MRFIPAKTLLSGYGEGHAWFGNNYNMNIYKGCSHGCIYCDSRSECYQIDNFDEVRAKEDALSILARELKAKRKKGVIGTGGMNDPYNPLERKHRLTRGALELIDAHGFGISATTKSDLVTRDVDVLQSVKRHSPALVKITITTAYDELCKVVEPHAALSSERFAAIKALAEEGIPAGVLMMPLLPFIEDNEENILGIVRQASESGARFVFPSFGVTLRLNQRDWYYAKLDEHFPQLKQRYIKQFGNSYECTSPRAKELWKVFRNECERLGILYKMEDIIADYKRGYTSTQLSLF